MVKIIWTDYLNYRAKLRGFELELISEIVKYSGERYFDIDTSRMIVIGKHNNILIMVAYEVRDDNVVVPVTIHATNRQQISYRVKNGRYQK